jgi:hypothetical protein
MSPTCYGSMAAVIAELNQPPEGKPYPRIPHRRSGEAGGFNAALLFNRLTGH